MEWNGIFHNLHGGMEWPKKNGVRVRAKIRGLPPVQHSSLGDRFQRAVVTFEYCIPINKLIKTAIITFYTRIGHQF